MAITVTLYLKPPVNDSSVIVCFLGFTRVVNYHVLIPAVATPAARLGYMCVGMGLGKNEESF